MSLEKAVSYIATMKNKKEFTKDELKGIIAYELQWLKPGEAETLIETATKKGYLKKQENSKIEIGIPTKKVSPNYEPDIDLENTGVGDDPISKMANHISTHTDKTFKEVIADMNDKYEEMGKSVSFETAAYLYGEDKGVEMSKFQKIINY